MPNILEERFNNFIPKAYYQIMETKNLQTFKSEGYSEGYKWWSLQLGIIAWKIDQKAITVTHIATGILCMPEITATLNN